MELSRYMPFFKASAFSELLKFITAAASCQSFFQTFFGFRKNRFFKDRPLFPAFTPVRKVLYHSIKDACFCQLIFNIYFIFFYHAAQPVRFPELLDSKEYLTKSSFTCQPVFYTFYLGFYGIFFNPVFPKSSCVCTYYMCMKISYVQNVERFFSYFICVVVQTKKDLLPV